MGDQLIRKLLRSNSKPELRKELMHRKEQLLLESTKKTVIDNNNNKKYDIE